MAGSFSDAYELIILDSVFGSGAPANIYLALMTAKGTNAQCDANTNWVEVTGGSYARKQVVNNNTNFPAASLAAGVATKLLHILQNFITPSADWGTVIALVAYDAVTAGTQVGWCDLNSNQTINNGNTVTVAADALQITQD